MNTQNKYQFCPSCFGLMVADENDKDIYYCYQKHLDGNYRYIDLNPDRPYKKNEKRLVQDLKK